MLLAQSDIYNNVSTKKKFSLNINVGSVLTALLQFKLLEIAILFADNFQMSVKKIIGKRIANKRIELGLSQEDLSYRSGVSVNTISAIENGKVYTKLNNLINVCKHLGLKLSDLFNGY